MSRLVTYGGYQFQPAPFFSLNDSPIFLSGQFDYVAQSISLVGQLTGCDLLSLKSARQNLIDACSSGFQTLTIGNTGFTYAKPVGINFQESKLTKILPYEITFEAYQNNEFSQFFGIIDPVDTWSYKEQDGRTISATHTVGGKAVKTSADSLAAVKNFVNNRLKGFDNLSIFHSGDSKILVNKVETLNRLSNSYEVTEEWSLSSALFAYDRADCLVRPNSKITFDGQNLSVSVEGVMNGGISGSISTGYFSPDDAKDYAKNATAKFKSLIEDNLYDQVFRGPNTYSYDVNTGANSINFSFQFSNPDNPNTGDVIHTFDLTFDCNKETPYISAQLKGNVFYDSYKDIFLTGAPEISTRYQKVDAYFSGINHYAITQQYFNYFKESNLPYLEDPLNTRYESLSINKKPFEASIDYSFSYSNKLDMFPNILLNSEVTIGYEHSISKYSINETIDQSFCTQELYKTLDRKTVTVKGNRITGVSLGQTISYLSGWMEQYSSTNGTLVASSLETGDIFVSMSKSFVIKT